jgi:CBS domain-containing protein
MAVKASDLGVAKAGLDVTRTFARGSGRCLRLTQLGPPSVPAIGVDYGEGCGLSTDVAACAPPYGRSNHANKELIQMPTGTTSDTIHHSFGAPPFESATVVDAMRMGVVSCPPDTPMREVARIMATYRIHCVVVAEVAEDAALGVIADIDIASAAAGSRDAPAGTLARTEPITVHAEDSIEHAAQLMAEHEVTHLVVVQPRSRHPVGILSALDIAGALAWEGTA